MNPPPKLPLSEKKNPGSAEPSPKGVTSSNTPPPTSTWTGAEDWFEWSFYVDWNYPEWCEFRNQMNAAKENAATLENCPEFMRSFQVNDEWVEVSASGSRAGKGGKGQYYAFKLQYKGIAISIADKQQAPKNTPNVTMRATGELCLLQGAKQSFEIGRALIEATGGEIISDKLSRVDMCLDLPEIPIDGFLGAYVNDCYICRANTHKSIYSNGVTIGFGSAPLSLRIYDKLAEVKLKANPTKRLAMKEYRWNGKEPGKATRIEFELRREALKKRGIDSVSDYFQKRAALTEYLTSKWFRLTETPVNRKGNNQSKKKTSFLWERVRKGFVEWAGNSGKETLEPLRKENADVSKMVKQAFGVLKSAANHRGISISDFQEFLNFALPELKILANDPRAFGAKECFCMN